MKSSPAMAYCRYQNWFAVFPYIVLISFSLPGFVAAATLQLGWVDNSQDEAGFHIERKVGVAGVFGLIATTGPNTTAYVDSNLADSTTYCYRVSAFNGAGDSAYTNEACATTSNGSPGSVPSAPPPISSPLAAVLLGQTGEDIAGTTSEGPDGIPDDHVRLTGAQVPITGVTIRDDGGCCSWQTPYNAVTGDWIAAIRPQADPTVVDLYFDVWQPGSSYTVSLTFADGSIQTVQASQAILGAALLSKQSAGVTVLANQTSSTATQAPPNGNPSVKVGIFRPGHGEWLLDLNGNGLADGCTVDVCVVAFGQTGDLPVTKRIGINATAIGIFRQGSWVFDRNGNLALDDCSVDECDDFGAPGDLPVTGDWGGSGTEQIGVYRPGTGEWFLDLNGDGQWDGCVVDKCLGPFGAAGDLPIAGDWDGSGKTSIGVFRPGTGEWFLDSNGNGQWDGCAVDKCLGPFGAAGDLPIAGDWGGSGKTAIGVFRPATGDWLLDLDANGKFDGCAVDLCLGPLGQPGDLPVVGRWGG